MGKSVEKKIQCIDCGKKTAKYYTVATNKGKIYKCDECYELGIIRSHRNASKIPAAKYHQDETL